MPLVVSTCARRVAGAGGLVEIAGREPACLCGFRAV
nr:MAG TPA: hypothetical protein [Caudoviricetes sp.]DAY08165.1 MAG TPA: hypothetical protein [Herelleviridae sp.]